MRPHRPLALVALVAATVFAFTACTAKAPESAAPPPAESSLVAADGIVLGDGPIAMELWTDLSCPHCAVLDEATGENIAGWVDEGTVTLTIHPMNYVSEKRGDTTDYSTRAANLLALTADAGELDAVLPLYSLLQANQVDADGAPTDDALLDFAAEAGVEADLADGVKGQTMGMWVQASNDHWLGEVVASDTAVDHVPLLVVDGTTFEIREDGTDGERLREVVAAAGN
ncbi:MULTISPECIES: DsbA family protein [unclassified Microbacterium]|uniref:DsbA family protein n=1 Tax=unclassified Microbacterium TaxID=2609290 RepID=UPI00214CCCA1|nr:MULTISPECIES: DsbA family protein [unclassified Microbacterium]MCR2783657.1 DsbA family protein [Microbacterium sp. zg.B96]WIM15485.1 DsbA family protein [Microbacterium sp. zg-B96]